MIPRVLVACERSQVVQQAFARLGAFSCSLDVRPSYGPDPSHHIIADAYDFDLTGWDLIIAHPPCTYLTNANSRKWSAPGAVDHILHALRLWARFLFESPCPVAVENPPGIANGILPPSQIVDPYLFGHPYKKRTCLWLRGLPPLFPTDIRLTREDWHRYSTLSECKRQHPGLSVSDIRSQTFSGLASAMASQWLPVITHTAHSRSDKHSRQKK